jgi:translation initiation factor eIF-2B subunit delta
MSANSSPKKAATPIPKEKKGSVDTAAAAAPGGKAISAKEAKKAKRAAQVLARGGNPDGPGAPGAAPPSGGPGSSLHASGGSAAGGSNPGPSRHRRALAEKEQAQAAAAAAAPSAHHLFFSHLPVQGDPGTPAALTSDKIHPIVVRLGVLIASGTLRGASARTIGVLQAFREVVRDYECPDTAVFWKDLSSHISPMIAYLETCRPKGVGVGNAIRWFKGEINRLGEQYESRPTANAEEAQKNELVDAIDGYIQDRIVVAGQVIADNIQEKIKPGATVVVYARSSVVERALLDAFGGMQARSPPQTFNVAVIDSRPLEEGK